LEGDYNNMQTYRKRHLVPFGEFIPFRNSFPPFEWIAGDLIPDDFDAGEEAGPMKLENKGIEIIPLICFEDTVGNLARSTISSAPQIIVNLTNDGWFGQSEGSTQHLINACFRSIELRRPLIRCANTGVSCLIDAQGRRLREIRDDDSGSHFVKGFLPLSVEVPIEPEITVYAKVGDLFSMTVFALSALLSLFYYPKAQ
ncbi:MAG: apolipoprotein N-acyltransferase, partial [Verrucomicrobiota bacterium]